MEDSTNNSLPGLPFLVVHWLSKFGGAPGNEAKDASQLDALDRIRRATNDLAHALADLGAFGVALNVSCRE
jgi:hypothetical protein